MNFHPLVCLILLFDSCFFLYLHFVVVCLFVFGFRDFEHPNLDKKFSGKFFSKLNVFILLGNFFHQRLIVVQFLHNLLLYRSNDFNKDDDDDDDDEKQIQMKYLSLCVYVVLMLEWIQLFRCVFILDD